MWYYILLFPFFFKFLHIVKFLHIKFNLIKSGLKVHSLFNLCTLNYTVLKQDINFNNHVIQALDLLVGFTELLPSSYKFYFHYRNKRYLEFFFIKTFVKYKTKTFFKVLNELFINFIKRAKLFPVHFSITNGELSTTLNIKYFIFFNKYISLASEFNTVINLQLRLDPFIMYFQTFLLKKYLFSNLFKIINNFKFYV